MAVPPDCTISIDLHANHSAIEHMRETLKAIIDKLAA